MNTAQLLPVFVVGLAGSIHCAGMCGGIVTAISVVPAQAATHRTPVRIVSMDSRSNGNDALLVLAYNTGRIGSYMLAGALAGGLAGGARSMAALADVQLGFYWLANLMLVALGLYLMNAWRGLARLEQGGRLLWRRIAPATRSLLPADTPAKSLALGALWGWLPCGMVYSALTTALLSGSAADGAAMMLAFGLGTLPMLTALGLLGARVAQTMQRRPMRIGAGLLVLSFGVLGLARAAGVTGVTGNLAPAWIEMLCLTPHA
ncbi:sulfite exporter TauE/SafE family protein [Duganella sp. BuS-21]|uniref:sulfite exporter TauE/SafE family protein n=1 Tax=Duganella sp. BuS-21 TaxID=2943848 RepID=UPI0035A5F51D